MSIPLIDNYFPKEADEGLNHTLILLGENFEQDSKVYMNNVEMAYTLVSATQIEVSLSDTLKHGRYLFRVENPDLEVPDRLEISREVEFRLLANRDSNPRKDYPEEIQDQRNQPFPPSLRGRRDTQRVVASSNFNGKLPDDEQGKFGDAALAPTEGGYWSFTEKVILTQFEFRTNGAEPGAGRTAGSGLYIRDKNGVDTKIINLSNTPDASKGQIEHAFFSDLGVEVEVGEAIVFLTFGATVEMQATIKTRIDRPYIR